MVAATAWVTHIDLVKVAIAECEIRLARGDWAGFREAAAKLDAVTEGAALPDGTPRRFAAMLATEGNARALEASLSSMQSDADRLMAMRLDEMDAARARSRVVFIIGAFLAIVAGAGVSVLLRVQRAQLFASNRGAHRGKALLEAVIETVDEGIVAVDAERRTIAINAAARLMVGDAFARERLAEDWRTELAVLEEDGSPVGPEDAPLQRALRGQASNDLVHRVVPAGESTGTWVSTSARPIRDEGGRVVAAVATLRDMTEQRASAERLRDLALTDELTGLLNRRGFLDAARTRVEQSRRANAPLGLLYADMDGLKGINDRFGHEQGDRAIADVAVALRRVFRDGDVVARIGGDEFIALLPNMAPSSEDSLLKRLATSLAAQASEEKRPYSLGLSAGLTFFDWSSAASLEELLDRADRSMYARKRARPG
jgi:diguanylate cyclase (GGDEF)-like protein/PAS domain S-box-containing protein